ncbi:tricorn protease [Siphonobacter aquaeclarae]|uniref:Tricorn protease homolog n=2 Tax=Siphonobacter aquaeclarae TaxID=563176 RepID=A0A1G9TYX1_9BACT|nr:tricorn protease [Siphonobacter aquaeclarae]
MPVTLLFLYDINNHAMRHLLLTALGASLLLRSVGLMAQSPSETLLLRQPSLSSTHIAFSYGGDLWVANRDGSNPRRLTVAPGTESGPLFSPDGQTIAFTGTYDGNADVYTISIQGGTPKRLTWHPAAEIVKGWSPDGKKILFASNSASSSQRYPKLFAVSLNGELPEELPVLMAGSWASYSPDGQTLAYTTIGDAFNTWKRYRGGMTTPIRLLNLKTLDSDVLPHVNASDVQPAWIGDKVYFLSDRDRIMNVYEYDRPTKKLRQVTKFTDYDVKSLSGNGKELVYEYAGRLHILEPGSGKTTPVPVSISPEILALRPTWKNVSGSIRRIGLSPTGIRMVVEARGDIYTVPAKKGDWRNLTQTDGVHDRNPIWSPKGDKIAYVSDAGGEYQLIIADQKGEKPAETISLGDPTFYTLSEWSADGKKILYQDKKLNLWYMDLATKKPVKVAMDTYGPNSSIDAHFSPDSKWITYSKKEDNYLSTIYLYELATAKSTPVSDGKSDANNPVFSRDGKYLFFTASTNTGLASGWLDMTAYDRRVTSSLYLAVLNAKDSSPFAPESDEEKSTDEPKKDDAKKEEPKKDDTKKGEKKDEKKDEKKEDKKDEKPADTAPKVVIDLDGITQRILALPVPAANIGNMESADGGKLFYVNYGGPDARPSLNRFDLKERKSEPFLPGVAVYTISADGKKLLYYAGSDNMGIVDVGGKVNMGDGKINASGLQALIDPRAEWKQMMDEFWRIERDYFYVPNLHGVDWAAVKQKYARFLPHVSHRSDLNYLIGEMMGEMVIGHNYVSGGDFPEVKPIQVGLLGADYEIANGFYRFKKVFNGENWNPNLRAPLTEPGVNVKAGEYLIAVNGKPIRSTDNIYRFFENQVGKQIVLTVNGQPSETGARKVTVVPVANEAGLRQMDWVESNRRKVDAATNGKVAYVYLPNTGADGYEFFNRYYYSQLDKEAVIIDERFNGGGMVADYIIDMLNRPLLSYWAPREGKPFTSPSASIYGPKVMIVNEYAGSGGDALPHFFRRRNLGTIIGKRTWGGLVGISGYPPLIDGGSVTSPSFGIYSPDGKWEVENVGVSPDIEVEMEPKATQNGNDPQLNKAIETVLEQLKQHPVKHQPIPKPDNRARD